MLKATQRSPECAVPRLVDFVEQLHMSLEFWLGRVRLRVEYVQVAPFVVQHPDLLRSRLGACRGRGSTGCPRAAGCRRPRPPSWQSNTSCVPSAFRPSTSGSTLPARISPDAEPHGPGEGGVEVRLPRVGDEHPNRPIEGADGLDDLVGLLIGHHQGLIAPSAQIHVFGRPHPPRSYAAGQAEGFRRSFRRSRHRAR